jgi:dTDP-4-amino-4,6-dideoxygalactose transaminase
VVVVDLYGQCADYDEIMPLCRELAVPVVEDAAEALGATYRQRRAGSLGDVGVLSFNGNKIVTTSGGGALVCDDEALAMRIRHLSTQARAPAPHYEHVELGFNYRLSNILAALGRAQLEQLAAKVETRRATNRRYRDLLAKVPGVEFMPDAPYGRPTNWLTCITLDPAQAPFTRDELIRHLADYNIESRPTWMPMHLQPQYRDAHCIGGSVAETIFHTGVCLPMVPARAEDRARIERALRDLIDAKHA